MKYRKGYVSNSSSSSFIIGSDMDPLLSKAMHAVLLKEESVIIESKLTPKEVALEMLLASDRGEILKHWDKFPNNVKYVAFQSCNYDTEILQIDYNRVLIMTCNNESSSWNEALDILSKKFSENYLNIEDDEEKYDKFVSENKYYEYNMCDTKELNGSNFDLDFNPVKIAKEYGPAVILGNKGVILYENETRVCIK